MTETAAELKFKLSQLSPHDRAELAHFLIRSLDTNADQELEDAWDSELARRAAEIENSTATGAPANEVMSRLREKYA